MIDDSTAVPISSDVERLLAIPPTWLGAPQGAKIYLDTPTPEPLDEYVYDGCQVVVTACDALAFWRSWSLAPPPAPHIHAPSGLPLQSWQQSYCAAVQAYTAAPRRQTLALRSEYRFMAQGRVGPAVSELIYERAARCVPLLASVGAGKTIGYLLPLSLIPGQAVVVAAVGTASHQIPEEARRLGLGDSVAYVVAGQRLERRRQTKILVMTSTTFLRVVEADPGLLAVSHVVLDEAHLLLEQRRFARGLARLCAHVSALTVFVVTGSWADLRHAACRELELQLGLTRPLLETVRPIQGELTRPRARLHFVEVALGIAERFVYDAATGPDRARLVDGAVEGVAQLARAVTYVHDAAVHVVRQEAAMLTTWRQRLGTYLRCSRAGLYAELCVAVAAGIEAHLGPLAPEFLASCEGAAPAEEPGALARYLRQISEDLPRLRQLLHRRFALRRLDALCVGDPHAVLGDLDECPLCWERPQSLDQALILIPCLHGPFCPTCAAATWGSCLLNHSGRSCPLCRGAVRALASGAWLREHLQAPAVEPILQSLSSKQQALVDHVLARADAEGPQTAAVVCSGLAGASRLYQALARHPALRVFALHGTDAGRSRVVADWRDHATRTGHSALLLLPLTLLCGQTAGLNLQETATVVYVLSPRHAQRDIHQTFGRFVRPGAGTELLDIYVLLSQQTLDTEPEALELTKTSYTAALESACRGATA